jgi:transporter family-2 protein
MSLINLYYIAPLIGGLAIAFLPGINNYIAKSAKSVGFALLLNFSLGTIVLSILYLTFSTVKFDELNQMPLWFFLGGLYGTVTVVVMTITPAKIGIGKTLAIFITARLTSATIIEDNGWLNMQQNATTLLQVLGVVVAIAGTVLILRVRATQSYNEKVVLLYYILCFLSGISSSLQSSINAALLSVTDDMLFVSWLNFSENLMVLFAFYLCYSLFFKVRMNFSLPGKIYSFGVLSAFGSLTVISMMAMGSLKVGVANTVILSVLTQLVVGTLIDHYGWLKVARHRFSAQSFLGLALLLAGVYFVVMY